MIRLVKYDKDKCRRIKKRLVGKKDFSYELKPAELNITEADLPLTGTVTVKGTISNAGDVLLLEAMVEAMVNRTCGRCLKAFTGKSTAEVLEKFYPASAENIEMMLLFMNLISSI